MKTQKPNSVTDLVSDQISETIVPAYPEVSMNEVRYSPKRFDRSADGNSKLSPICLATKEGVIYGYRIEKNIYPAKFIEYVGGEEFLKDNIVGLQQIRGLALKQTPKKKKGVLDLNCENYFPVLDKNGKVIFVFIQWARYKSSEKLVGAHSWEFLLKKEDGFLYKGSQVFIFQSK